MVGSQNRGIEMNSEEMQRTMSVPEMRNLLGLKKTEGYWLVHKNYFITEIIDGTMRVNIDSFEAWYANQTRYKKNTGEEPGAQLRLSSYSFREVANMLGVYDATIYEEWNKNNLPIIIVNNLKRIPTDVFDEWYKNQNKYHKVDGPATIEEIKEKYIPFREAAEIVGMKSEDLFYIIRREYPELIDMRMYDNMRWISRSGFQDFLNVQDKYKIKKTNKSAGSKQDNEFEKKTFISKDEAARIARVSKSTICKWALKGFFPCEAAGIMMRIERKSFLKWLSENKKVV